MIQSEKGFTLIELVIAVVVLGISMGLFSHTLMSISEKSVVPVVSLKSAWIARSYLDYVAMHLENDVALCSDKNMNNVRDHGNKMAQNSILVCVPDLNQLSSIRDFRHKSVPGLSDYQVSVTIDEVDDALLKKKGFYHKKGAITQYESSHYDKTSYHLVATVQHAAIEPIKMERWVWVK